MATLDEPHVTEAAIQQPQVQAQAQTKWPGWPGDNVFRLIVPVTKVGAIIGRKGELIKKMCDETRARVRILDAPVGTVDRIVLISGKEEPEMPLSPAMDAVFRVFRCVSGLSPGDHDSTGSAAADTAFCSIKLLVAFSQSIHLIGKHGSTIKSMQESTGASVRVLAEEELPSYANSDERIVEIQGEAAKVYKALEAVIQQLRKFLVDHTVIPMFEKTYNAAASQEHSVDKNQPFMQSATAPQTGIASEYSFSLKRDPSIYDYDKHLEPKILQPELSRYGRDLGSGGLRSTGLGHAAAPVVTQVTQTMQIPLSYAEDIVGVGGSNIAHIRRTSGAILTIQETRGVPDEITVEIKGSPSQVMTAQALIEEFISNKEPAPIILAKMDPASSAYSQVRETSYPSSSFTSRLGGYEPLDIGGYRPGVGGYNSFRY